MNHKFTLPDFMWYIHVLATVENGILHVHVLFAFLSRESSYSLNRTRAMILSITDQSWLGGRSPLSVSLALLPSFLNHHSPTLSECLPDRTLCAIANPLQISQSENTW